MNILKLGLISDHLIQGKTTQAKRLFNSYYAKNKDILANLVLERANPLLISLLISKGSDVSYKFSRYDGHSKRELTCSILHGAVFKGKVELMDYLLSAEAGQNVNAKDEEGPTPLMTAATYNRIDIARKLVENHADVNIATASMITALHVAAVNNAAEVLAFLIPKVANVSAKDQTGLTALHIAVIYGKFEVAKIIIDHTNIADLNEITPRGETALHLAIQKNNIELATLLLLSGSNVNAKTHVHHTPMDIAIAKNNTEIINLLVKFGANLDGRPHRRDVLISSLKQVYESIDKSIINKDTISEMDIVELKFIKKYSNKIAIKLKFGQNIASHPIYKYIEEIEILDIKNFDQTNFKHIDFILMNFQNKYVKALLSENLHDFVSKAVLGVRTSLEEHSPLYNTLAKEGIREFLNGVDSSSTEAEKVQLKSYAELVLKASHLFYADEQMLYRAAIIAAKIIDSSDTDAEIEAVKLLIDNNHAQIAVNLIEKGSISISKAVKGINLFYYASPDNIYAKSHEKIAPAAKFLLLNKCLISTEDNKFMLATFLLHARQFGEFEAFVHEMKFDINYQTERSTLLTHFIKNQDVDVVKYLLDLGSALFIESAPYHASPNYNALVAASVVSSQDMLEIICDKLANRVDVAEKEARKHAIVDFMKASKLTLDDLQSYSEVCGATSGISDRQIQDFNSTLLSIYSASQQSTLKQNREYELEDDTLPPMKKIRSSEDSDETISDESSDSRASESPILSDTGESTVGLTGHGDVMADTLA